MTTATLAARIRVIGKTMPAAEIARRLGTSTAYVRVVLNQRRDGMSKYDRAYKARVDSARLRRHYNAVPRAERDRIRAEFLARVVALGGVADARARARACALIRQLGREILAGAGHGGEGETEGQGAPRSGA